MSRNSSEFTRLTLRKFYSICKNICAYAFSLTDEVAHKNWQEYGNSDGPGGGYLAVFAIQWLNVVFSKFFFCHSIKAINFGMALPKWMIEKENTVLVVGVYAVIFMLMLPLVVVCRTFFGKTSFKDFS